MSDIVKIIESNPLIKELITGLTPDQFQDVDVSTNGSDIFVRNLNPGNPSSFSKLTNQLECEYGVSADDAISMASNIVLAIKNNDNE